MSSLIVYKIYFILVHFGYKWLGLAKTFPITSHLTSYVTYLLRYDPSESHPNVKFPLEMCQVNWQTARPAHSGQAGRLARSGQAGRLARSGQAGRLARSGQAGRLARSRQAGRLARSGQAGRLARTGQAGPLGAGRLAGPLGAGR